MAPVDTPLGADLRIEVVVGVAPRQIERVQLVLSAGSTVRQALEASGLIGRIEGLTLATIQDGTWTVGVWGRRERAGHVLHDRDRIELVRGLLVDPKEARRVRYSANRIPRGVRLPPRVKNKLESG
jgi:putative ubiquitin-RnfH superfamily antitoxin RatB of RatAB toxin-antitoxin module